MGVGGQEWAINDKHKTQVNSVVYSRMVIMGKIGQDKKDSSDC